VHLRNACQVMEQEIKQLKANQAEGKTQGPHPYQQTLKNMLHALTKAKLTLEKVDKMTEKEEPAVTVAMLDDEQEVTP